MVSPEKRGQPSRHPGGGVVVLAEHDASLVEPPSLPQKAGHLDELWVLASGALQVGEYLAKAIALFQRHLRGLDQHLLMLGALGLARIVGLGSLSSRSTVAIPLA
jgi:hypothetical protein